MANSRINLKKLIIILSLFVTGALVSACIDSQVPFQSRNDGSFKQFSSLEELDNFISNANSLGYGSYDSLGIERTMAASEALDAVPMTDTVSNDGSNVKSASDFSETNIQVKGVDEADIIKNDGKYIYYLTNNVVYIVDVFPADEMEIISEIEIEDAHFSEIFIFDEKLVLLGQTYKDINSDDSVSDSSATSSKRIAPDVEIAMPGIMPPHYRQKSHAFVAVYNIEDRLKPVEEEMISLEGNYYNSRLIDNHLYMISNNYVGDNFIPPVIYYADTHRTIPASDIFYFDIYDNSYELSTILSVNLDDNSFSEKLILKGSSQNIYVSKENIYLTGRKQIPYTEEQRRIIDDVYKRMLPNTVVNEINRIDGYEIREATKISEIEFLVYDYFSTLEQGELDNLVKSMEDEVENIRKEIRDERDRTLIHRVSVDGKNIEMEASGEVPGYVLNQFSMDERNDHFRIATTRGNMWDEQNPSSNNLYVLNLDLDVVGSLENVAPTERIYSVRFMEDRAYMVTFRNIDPLFVIDLSSPTSPEILGELKIPGYSDYLHPYDENHIIGVGKEVVEDNERAIPEGVKLALFDVSDVTRPKEVAKIEIGYRGSDSEALRDHKAFLFDKSRNLLIIPVLERARAEDETRPWAYGETIFQGAYVFEITPEDGFVEKGKVTHMTEDDKKDGRMYMWSDSSIRRTLYMDDVLYTLSATKLKANSLDTLDSISSLVFYEYEEPVYGYYGDVSGSTPSSGVVTDEIIVRD